MKKHILTLLAMLLTLPMTAQEYMAESQTYAQRLRLELDRERWAALGDPKELTVHVSPEQVMALKGDPACTT